jgi:predicted flap endonuclease-1-like 5' DNA nuclease
MADKLAMIKGIDADSVAKLKDMSIDTTDELLENARSAAQRKELAAKIGVDAKIILEWVNRADLMRINGVGTEYANLLEECGVDSCKELQHRKPENLHAKLKEVNEAKDITKRLPTAEQVEGWVKQAAELAATGPTH